MTELLFDFSREIAREAAGSQDEDAMRAFFDAVRNAGFSHETTAITVRFVNVFGDE